MATEQDILVERSVGFVVIRVEMDNYTPACFNDLLCIESEIVELKQIIISPNKQCLVSVLIRVACVNLSNMKPQVIPDNILGEFLRVI
jgi:acyl-CoA thioester hydrolase